MHLKTANDVRFEMSKVYREVRAGKLEAAHGCKLIYMLGEIAKLISAQDYEKRLAALEQFLEEKSRYLRH